jgi:hypothetical protein
MAFNFMNAPVKHEAEGKIVYRVEAWWRSAARGTGIRSLINRLKDAERGSLRFSVRELWRIPCFLRTWR